MDVESSAVELAWHPPEMSCPSLAIGVIHSFQTVISFSLTQMCSCPRYLSSSCLSCRVQLQFADGLDRIYSVHAAYNPFTNRPRRSATPIITSLQPRQSIGKDGRQAGVGFLQRVPIVSHALGFSRHPSDSHSRETAIIRDENETPNDRNDRGSLHPLSIPSHNLSSRHRYSQSHGMV